MERGIPEGDQATGEALADGKSVSVMGRGITEGDRAPKGIKRRAKPYIKPFTHPTIYVHSSHYLSTGRRP